MELGAVECIRIQDAHGINAAGTLGTSDLLGIAS